MANIGKLNAIQEMIMEDMGKATDTKVELSPEVFSYLSKHNYAAGSINWYNALEALSLNPQAPSSIKTNVTNFFYYEWAPYLGNQLLSIFAIEDKDIPKLQKAAVTQVENFMSNPRSSKAFWGGSFAFAKCICYYKVTEGMRDPSRRANDIEDVREFIDLVFDAFKHWLGGGSVSYKFGKGQQRINAAFMSSTPIGDSQSSIVARDDDNGNTALYYGSKLIEDFDQLLAYRGQEMAGGSSSGGFRTSIWRLFRDRVALNPDFYDSDDLARALGIKDLSTSNIAQDAYNLVQEINAGKTEDVFYDLTKDVIFNDKQSLQRVKDAAANFPAIYDSVMVKKSGKYFDICNKIKAAAHLDLTKGMDKDSTHGVGAGEELQNLFRSLFLVNTTLAFNDYQRKGTLSSGTLGDQVQVKESEGKMQPALDVLNEDTDQPLGDDDNRKEGEKNKSKIRRLITDLGLNWSGSFLEYFDNLMSYSQKKKSDNLYKWKSDADIKKPLKSETPYQRLFSYYLLYLASILNLGDDYSLKNVYKNLQEENKYTEQILLTLAYVEGRVYDPGAKNLAYTYDDRSKIVEKGGDLQEFKNLLSDGYALGTPEVKKLLQAMKSRQADGESILGMVWDTYRAECKNTYPDYDVDGSDNTYSGYNDNSLSNLYSLCKDLYEAGKEDIANNLIKLLSEVIQKNVVAVKEPLPL